VSWGLVIALGVLSLVMRGAGHVALGDRILGPVTERRLQLVTYALLGAVVAGQAFSTNGSATLDARAIGMGAAVAVALAGGPLLGIFAAATVATAVARLFGVA
jgi:branched-subunit amino acid transport protein